MTYKTGLAKTDTDAPDYYIGKERLAWAHGYNVAINDLESQLQRQSRDNDAKAAVLDDMFEMFDNSHEDVTSGLDVHGLIRLRLKEHRGRLASNTPKTEDGGE